MVVGYGVVWGVWQGRKSSLPEAKMERLSDSEKIVGTWFEEAGTSTRRFFSIAVSRSALRALPYIDLDDGVVGDTEIARFYALSAFRSCLTAIASAHKPHQFSSELLESAASFLPAELNDECMNCIQGAIEAQRFDEYFDANVIYAMSSLRHFSPELSDAAFSESTKLFKEEQEDELLLASLSHEMKISELVIVASFFERLKGIAVEENAWTFWREWYQGFVDGNPMDWELQRQVALIADPIWEAGPEAVAEEIERIRAEYLAETAPQAERVEFNPETAKFYTVPLDVAKPDLLGATLSQVEDALEDVLASASNGLHDNAREVRVLRRVFTKYGNDPQQIEMGFVSVHKGLTRQMLNEELPASEENLALQTALEEGARGIRATHPEVAENRKILTDQAIREMPEDAVELLEDVKPLLAAYSEGDLADDWAQDIPQLINDALLPLPSGAPSLPGMDEATRIFSRSAKMKMQYDVITKKGAEIFDSHGMKTTRLGLTLGGALSALVGLGLRLFGLI